LLQNLRKCKFSCARTKQCFVISSLRA